MKKAIVILLTAALLILVGCDGIPESEGTPVEAIPLPERTEEEPTLAPFPTDAPGSQAADPDENDGTGEVHFLLTDMAGALWSQPVPEGEALAISPQDTRTISAGTDPYALSRPRVAFLTQPMTARMMEVLSITIADIRSGEILAEVPLLPPDFETGVISTDFAQMWAYENLSRDRGFHWSPDGNTLAYAGMTEAFPADIYLIDGADYSVERATATLGYATNPIWSPDGRQLFFYEYTSVNEESFTPAERSVMVMTVADRAISRVEELPGEGTENWLGWLDESTLLAYTADSCGPKNLRAIDKDSLAVTPLFTGSFTAADFDPATGTIVLGVGAFAPTCTGAGPTEIVRIVPGTDPETLSDLMAYSVEWAPGLNAFIVLTSGEANLTLLVMPSGLIGELPGEQPFQIRASATGIIAFLMDDNSLYIGDKAGPSRQIAEGVLSFKWSGDGHYLAIIRGDGVNLAIDPEFALLSLFPAGFIGTSAGSWTD